MKTYILGGPGNGKSTYSKILSKKHNIPRFDLDDIKWDNTSGQKYTKDRTSEQNQAMISEIINNNENWIFEGVYSKDWVNEIFEKAYHIIILCPPRFVRQYRCIKRHFKKPKNNRESLRSLWGLLKWGHCYEVRDMPVVIAKAKQFNKECKYIKKFDL